MHNAAIKVTFQKSSVIGMRFTDMRKGWRYGNIWEMTDTTALNAKTATLLAAFIWRRRLNSVSLANATHRRSGNVADGTSTQVKVQMINRCKEKMSQKELYKLKDSPQKKGRKKEREEKGENVCIICILFSQYIWTKAFSDTNTRVLKQWIHIATRYLFSRNHLQDSY